MHGQRVARAERHHRHDRHDRRPPSGRQPDAGTGGVDMALRDMIDKAKSATDGLGDLAQTQLKGWLADFKKAAAVLETFGFTIGKVGFGMGALPEIHTSLVGSIDDIHEDKLQKLMEEHKGEELLVSLL